MDNVDKVGVRDTEQGAVLHVKAVPGASRDRVVGVLGNALKVTTSSPPEKGRANSTITEMLASFFGVKCSDVYLLSGQTTARKAFCFTSLSANEVRSKLARQ